MMKIAETMWPEAHFATRNRREYALPAEMTPGLFAAQPSKRPGANQRMERNCSADTNPVR
jgi:hypothetical protein